MPSWNRPTASAMRKTDKRAPPRLSPRRAPRRTLAILALALAAATPRVAPADEAAPPALTRVEQLRGLGPDEAKRGGAVRLRAVVTYVDPVGPNLFVQDRTGGVWVDLRGLGDPPRPGEELDLRGTVGSGFAPYVATPRWTVLGRVPMPTPRRVFYAQMATGELDGEWVEIEGIVRRFVLEAEGRVLVIHVSAEGHRFTARIPGFGDPLPMELVGARVSMRGVSGAAFNTKNQLVNVHLFVPGLAEVRVLEAVPPDVFDLPVRPIARVAQFSPRARDLRVRLQGTVTLQIPGQRLFIRDATAAIEVETDDGGTVEPGRQVDVVGFPRLGGFTPVLEAARFRPAAPGPPPAPVPTTAHDALKGAHAADLVEIDAEVQDDTADATGRRLVLKSGPIVFDAHLQADDAATRAGSLEAGTRVRLVGVCSLRIDENGTPAAFRILLRTADDVGVLAVPSKWTRERVLAALGLAALVALLALAWVAILRRRVRQQTRVIQARLEREAALEDRFERVFRSSPLAIGITEAGGRILDANAQCASLFGYTRAEMIGRSARELGLWVDIGDRERALEDLRAGRPVRNREVRVQRKTGEIRHVLLSMERLDLSAEEPALVVVASDITDQKGLEEQLRQSQKMDAVGRLAGGIAHDFNNLLAVIVGYAELVQRALGAAHPAHRRVEEIRKAADRATGLTRQLLAFSRKQVLAPRVMDLNTVVSDTAKMLQRLIGEDVRLATDLAPHLGRVKADPGQVEQVLVNLAVNARDAMAAGGQLTIQTRNVLLDAAYARSQPDAHAGRHVMVAVTDTGHGMDAETLSHMFEPFFTTKERGKGTGLGLATVHGIVRQSGGHVTVSSEPDRGTTFKVYLPVIQEHPEAAGSSAPGEAGPSGSETILVVEDESALREMITEILESAGYTVLNGPTPEEALAAAGAHEGPIPLVLTDVIMPGMSGRQLADELRSSRPDARVIFMSGYTGDAIGQHGVLEPGVNFLQKPFASDSLLRKVRDVLNEAPPSHENA
jgi:PAS domain S-box-containing protein